MSAVLAQLRSASQQDHTRGRSVDVETVRTDAAGEPHNGKPPGFDSTDIDVIDPAIIPGLHRSMVAPDRHPAIHSGPKPGSNMNVALGSIDHVSVINNQISSAGTAAAREREGIWGHGSVEWAYGISPEIRDGAQFGGNTFASWGKPVAEGQPASIASPIQDMSGADYASAFVEYASAAARQVTQTYAFRAQPNGESYGDAVSGSDGPNG